MEDSSFRPKQLRLRDESSRCLNYCQFLALCLFRQLLTFCPVVRLNYSQASVEPCFLEITNQCCNVIDVGRKIGGCIAVASFGWPLLRSSTALNSPSPPTPYRNTGFTTYGPPPARSFPSPALWEWAIRPSLLDPVSCLIPKLPFMRAVKPR